jgi:hypothetical protein
VLERHLIFPPITEIIEHAKCDLTFAFGKFFAASHIISPSKTHLHSSATTMVTKANDISQNISALRPKDTGLVDARLQTLAELMVRSYYYPNLEDAIMPETELCKFLSILTF